MEFFGSHNEYNIEKVPFEDERASDSLIQDSRLKTPLVTFATRRSNIPGQGTRCLLPSNGMSLRNRDSRFGYVETTNLDTHHFYQNYRNFDNLAPEQNKTKNNPVMNFERKTPSKITSTRSSPMLEQLNKKEGHQEGSTKIQPMQTITHKHKSALNEQVPSATYWNCSYDTKVEDSQHIGRSILDAKRGANCEQCYLPKKVVHTYRGHQKGVQKILWLPKSAHLLLSAGLDGKIKIWDVFKDRRCLHTYKSHERGVRDIDFSKDGKTFISSSFDKCIKLWDTETGKVKLTIDLKQIGYAVKFHPEADKQNILLVGGSARRIYQYDLNTGDIVQEYDRHLDAVNTITFINQNRWFLTTSDDRTIRAWEFGITEQIKYIADPSMHSIPSVGVSPCKKWILMQSMDNTIITYGVNSRLRVNRKKSFKGHSNLGYACQVGMSPDSRYVLSGDGSGKCYFWDWNSTLITRSLKAHDGACMGALWHPFKTSNIATCGYGDALIKLWD